MKTKKFIEKANRVHNNFYNYDKTTYSFSKNKVIVTCPRHGDFKIRASNHISSNQGCPKCSLLKMKKSKSSNKDEFVLKAKSVHRDTYDYNEVDYKNSRTKVKKTTNTIKYNLTAGFLLGCYLSEVLKTNNVL